MIRIFLTSTFFVYRRKGEKKEDKREISLSPGARDFSPTLCVCLPPIFKARLHFIEKPRSIKSDVMRICAMWRDILLAGLWGNIAADVIVMYRRRLFLLCSTISYARFTIIAFRNASCVAALPFRGIFFVLLLSSVTIIL